MMYYGAGVGAAGHDTMTPYYPGQQAYSGAGAGAIYMPPGVAEQPGTVPAGAAQAAQAGIPYAPSPGPTGGGGGYGGLPAAGGGMAPYSGAPMQPEPNISQIQGGAYPGSMPAGYFPGTWQGAAGQAAALQSSYGKGSPYTSALAANQGLYGQIMTGYQHLLGARQSSQEAIEKGYSGLSNRVLGDIQNVGGAQKQEISDVYAQRRGAADQQLINSGLGNTTVRSSVQRGLGFDETKSQIALADQMAQLRAGYRSQLGLAGLGYAERGTQQGVGVGEAMLGFQGQQLSQRNQLGLGYSQLAQQQQAEQGRLGLGYTQAMLGAQEAQGRLGLGYATLGSSNAAQLAQLQLKAGGMAFDQSQALAGGLGFDQLNQPTGINQTNEPPQMTDAERAAAWRNPFL